MKAPSLIGHSNRVASDILLVQLVFCIKEPTWATWATPHFMEYFDDGIDNQADIFYNNVRAIVVVFLTVSFLLPLSYFAVISRQKINKPWLSKDDASAHRFVVAICTFSLTVSAIMIFMLPLSILANEVLIVFPQSYYVQWINAELLQNFFAFTTTTFKCLCVLMPFSLFFLLSHGAHKGRNAVSSRLFCAFLYLLFSYVATFGVLSTLSATSLLILDPPNDDAAFESVIFGLQKFCFKSVFLYYTWPFRPLGDFMCCIDAALITIEQMFSYAGLGLLLVCIPFGILRVILQTLNMRASPPKHYCSQMVDDKYRIRLQKCLDYIKRLNNPFPCAPYTQVYRVYSQRDLDLVDDVTDHGEYQPKKTVRSICFFLLVILFVCLVTMAAAYTSVNVVVLLWSLLLSYGNESATPHNADTLLLGRESVSKLGSLGATLQVRYL